MLELRKGDIYSKHDCELYEGQFVRFIEAVNKMPTSTSRVAFPQNTQSIAHNDSAPPIRRKTASAPQSIGRVRSNDGSSTDLNIVTDMWLSHLKEISANNTISRKSIKLPSSLFVAYDLITWLRTKISVISSKKDAISYANMMLQSRRIRLLPNNTEDDETVRIFYKINVIDKFNLGLYNFIS